MNTTAYLNRINYTGSIKPTADTLRELQLAHLLTVPFENLSIHWKQPIILDEGSLFEKIVARRRGGFCYELNGLFAGLLRSLGFDVEMLSAGVFNSEGEVGPDFDHMTLMVTLEDRWLADVGFGDSFREPLLLDTREVQIQDERSYQIIPDEAKPKLEKNEGLILKQQIDDGEWENQYRFTLQPHVFADYEQMCSYHQTSPQSHFTRARVCSRATPSGRITLSELRFITTVGLEKHERVIPSEGEYDAVLRESFGVERS